VRTYRPIGPQRVIGGSRWDAGEHLRDAQARRDALELQDRRHAQEMERLREEHRLLDLRAVKQVSAKRKPGPASKGRERMRQAWRSIAEQQFKTEKEEYAAILKHMGINGAVPRGLGYSNYRAMKRENV
jgi:hypothetical protein